MLNKTCLIKNTFFVLTIFFFSMIDTAWAVVPDWCTQGGYVNNPKYPACVESSTDVNAQVNPDVSFTAAERANIESQKQQGILKVTQSQIKSILNPISVLKDATGQYTAKLQTYAERLFWFLAVLTFTYQFGFMALKRSDVGELFAELTKNRRKEPF